MFIYWPNNYYLETICSYTNRELYKHKQIISGKYVWAYIVRLLHIYCNTHRPEFISQRSSFYPFFFFPLLFLLLCTYVYTLLLLLCVCVCVTTTKKCNFSRRFGRKERERKEPPTSLTRKRTLPINLPKCSWPDILLVPLIDGPPYQQAASSTSPASKQPTKNIPATYTLQPTRQNRGQPAKGRKLSLSLTYAHTHLQTYARTSMDTHKHTQTARLAG